MQEAFLATQIVVSPEYSLLHLLELRKLCLNGWFSVHHETTGQECEIEAFSHRITLPEGLGSGILPP